MTELETKLTAIKNEKDTKIVPENIKKDVTIFDVTGTLQPGTDTSDASAVASDIAKDKTAYVNGQKITGNIPVIEANNNTITDVTKEIHSESEVYKIDKVYKNGVNNTTDKINLTNGTIIDVSTLPVAVLGKQVFITYYFKSNRYYYYLAYTDLDNYFVAFLYGSPKGIYCADSDFQTISYNYYTVSSSTKLDFNSINWGSVNTTSGTLSFTNTIGNWWCSNNLYAYPSPSDGVILYYAGAERYRYLQSSPIQSSKLLRTDSHIYTPVDTYNIALQENITPDKIKKGIEILGVTGTYEGTGGGVKLFDTIEHMQQDPTMQENDLAVVYKNELQSITADSEFSKCIFPQEVVLDSAYSGSIYAQFNSTGDDWFDGNVELSSTAFRFSGYGDIGEIEVEYTSQDGITYTRTDGGDNEINFGTTIMYMDTGEEFNSIIGNFMKLSSSVFNGLFNAKIVDVTTRYIVNNKTYVFPQAFIDKMNELFALHYVPQAVIIVDSFTEQGDVRTVTDCWLYSSSFYISVFTTQDTNNIYVCMRSNLALDDSFRCHYDGTNITVDDTNLSSIFDTLVYTNGTTPWYADQSHSSSSIIMQAIPGKDIASDIGTIPTINSTSGYIRVPTGDAVYDITLKYIVADNQFTTIASDVYESVFYGKNGIETGTLNSNKVNNIREFIAKSNLYNTFRSLNLDLTVKDLNQAFMNNSNIVVAPEMNTSHVTMFNEMFRNCTNLVSVPDLDLSHANWALNMFYDCSSLVTAPNLTIGPSTGITGMSAMFYNCSSLVNVPVYDTSNFKEMGSMFGGCTSLSNESLNNIMQMCINATKIANRNRTLKYIGLTQAQATTCQTLSNYQAFLDAGWTTGY